MIKITRNEFYCPSNIFMEFIGKLICPQNDIIWRTNSMYQGIILLFGRKKIEAILWEMHRKADFM